MPRGSLCALPGCGKRSGGRNRTEWHRRVTAANCDAVRACLCADRGDDAADVAEAIKEGAEVCVGCWPQQPLELFGDLLGARLAFLDDRALRRGTCVGIRTPGSSIGGWARRTSDGSSALLQQLTSAKIFEVKFDGASSDELFTLVDVRRAHNLEWAVAAGEQACVTAVNRRMHTVFHNKERGVKDEREREAAAQQAESEAREKDLREKLEAALRQSSIARGATFSRRTFCRAFFELPGNDELFQSMTGFDDWEQAHVIFTTWFKEFIDEKIGKLSAFQWFLVASWVMRHDPSHVFVCKFTGEATGVVSQHAFIWALRMEQRSAHSWIGVPDICYLLDTVPQRHVDNNMRYCVGFGDGTDTPIDAVRAHSRVRQMQHSSKIGCEAARAVALATGSALVMAATPMCLARATEGTLMKLEEFQDALRKIPPVGELGFDKGEQNMQGMCPNLNFCFVPTTVDGRSKGGTLNVQTGSHSRGVAENRYSIEVVMRGAKTFRLLRGRVGRQRIRWIQPTWIWALGVHNLLHKMLRPPHDESTHWKRRHREGNTYDSKWTKRQKVWDAARACW